jgi:glycosyltransferase involved in cell wall biosynthesis
VLAGVCKIVEREQIADQVRILGYVDDVTIATLYAGAWGVILPTFFGPTNIPVIEGWAMGVPVLTSDIRGIREQCDDAAILVDPLSAEAIADGMRRLWMDDALRARLISAGTERMKENDATMFRDRLAGILADVEHGLRANEPRTVPA